MGRYLQPFSRLERQVSVSNDIEAGSRMFADQKVIPSIPTMKVGARFQVTSCIIPVGEREVSISSDIKDGLTMFADHQKATLSNKSHVDGRKKYHAMAVWICMGSVRSFVSVVD
jgi:hypothetical protein